MKSTLSTHGLKITRSLILLLACCAALLVALLLSGAANLAQDPPPMSILWPNQAIVALNFSDCEGNLNGASFGGTGRLDVYGGSIFTFGCLAGAGSSYDVVVHGGHVVYAGKTSGVMNFDPPPEYIHNVIYPIIDFTAVMDARCAQLPSYPVNPSITGQRSAANRRVNSVIYPGNYPSIELGGGLTMMPGLYCVTGNVQATSGEAWGDGVTFYMTGGDLTVNASANLYLSAPIPDKGDDTGVIDLLFYITNGDATLNLTKDQYYRGVFYAPHGDITVSGSGKPVEKLFAQFIGWNTKFTGTTDIKLTLYSMPTPARR
jgi:hypothetical protein